MLNTAISPVLNAPVEVRHGLFSINSSATVTLNGPLANRDRLRWVSDNNVFDLQGSGRVENVGLWEVFADPGCLTCGSEAVVRVPVNVPVGGEFLMSTNAHVNFTAGSSLTVGGQLEIQSGARLHLDGSTPGRDVTLLAGSVLSGLGTIQLDGNCRLLVPGDLDTTVAINLNSSAAQLVVPGIYTVRSSQTMNGTINSMAVVMTSNATLNASSANFKGLVRWRTERH